MGYSISAETHERIKKLEAEGRRCSMGRCSARSTYVQVVECIDYKADGSVAYPLTVAKGPITLGYCGKHHKENLRAYEVHGKPVERADALPPALGVARRYEVSTGSGSKQVNTLLSWRKLEKNERLSTGRP